MYKSVYKSMYVYMYITIYRKKIPVKNSSGILPSNSQLKSQKVKSNGNCQIQNGSQLSFTLPLKN